MTCMIQHPGSKHASSLSLSLPSPSNVGIHMCLLTVHIFANTDLGMRGAWVELEDAPRVLHKVVVWNQHLNYMYKNLLSTGLGTHFWLSIYIEKEENTALLMSLTEWTNNKTTWCTTLKKISYIMYHATCITVYNLQMNLLE